MEEQRQRQEEEARRAAAASAAEAGMPTPSADGNWKDWQIVAFTYETALFIIVKILLNYTLLSFD